MVNSSTPPWADFSIVARKQIFSDEAKNSAYRRASHSHNGVSGPARTETCSINIGHAQMSGRSLLTYARGSSSHPSVDIAQAKEAPETSKGGNNAVRADGGM